MKSLPPRLTETIFFDEIINILDVRSGKPARVGATQRIVGAVAVEVDVVRNRIPADELVGLQVVVAGVEEVEAEVGFGVVAVAADVGLAVGAGVGVLLDLAEGAVDVTVGLGGGIVQQQVGRADRVVLVELARAGVVAPRGQLAVGVAVGVVVRQRRRPGGGGFQERF